MKRLTKESIELSLQFGTEQPKFEQGIVFVKPDVEYRMDHVSCPAGEDKKKRLYLKLKPDGTVLYYCHNCGGSLVTRNNTTYQNYRQTEHVGILDDSRDPTGIRASDWERDGFAEMYGHAWTADEGCSLAATDALYELSGKVAREYGVRGWFYDGFGQDRFGTPYFGGYLSELQNEFLQTFAKKDRALTILRLFFPVFDPDADRRDPRSLRMLSIKQVPADEDSAPKNVPLPDGMWKWKHFVYNDGGRIAPVVDNPGKSVCVLVEDRLSSLLLQDWFNGAITTVCLNGTNLREEHAFILAINPAYNRLVVWLDNDSDTVRQKAVDISRTLSMFGSKGVNAILDAKDPKKVGRDGAVAQLASL